MIYYLIISISLCLLSISVFIMFRRSVKNLVETTIRLTKIVMELLSQNYPSDMDTNEFKNENIATNYSQNTNLVFNALTRNLGIKNMNYGRNFFEPILTPKELFSQISQATGTLPYNYFKPYQRQVPWGMGVSTIKGNVRDENQDYCLGFYIADYQVLIVADGMGGLKYGAQASYIAVRSAAISIICSLTGPNTCRKISPMELATKAMDDAAHNLSWQGDKTNILNNGLRTTLIISIGSKDSFDIAYIGDGGGSIIRDSGKIDHFFEPQKAYSNIMNVLAASLGPTIDGKPVFMHLPRFNGDLLVIGTDGIFDCLEKNQGDFPIGTDRFLNNIFNGAVGYSGDLQKVTEQVVNELAELKDSYGYIFHDNLTFSILGNGHPSSYNNAKAKDNSISDENEFDREIEQPTKCEDTE